MALIFLGSQVSRIVSEVGDSMWSVPRDAPPGRGEARGALQGVYPRAVTERPHTVSEGPTCTVVQVGRLLDVATGEWAGWPTETLRKNDETTEAQRAASGGPSRRA